jgi:aspartate aminotransferase/aromatic-amino-acid transaminase
VKRAEEQLLQLEQSKSYLPIVGDSSYASGVQELLFAGVEEVLEKGLAVTAHAPGGTGALRVGAELVKRFRPQAKVWLSSPTWANHKGVFATAGFSLGDYSYYDAVTKELDFPAMQESLGKIPAGDIVLLHACCHNPSGVDPNKDQWHEVARLAAQQGWIPFLDFAYQGFAESVEADRLAIEEFARAGVEFLVASSFSKNFGLYNERAGALTLVCKNKTEAEVAMSHLKTTIRVLYSNPPAHGGLVVAAILKNPELRSLWMRELGEMRERIIAMRAALVDGLKARGVAEDFSYIKRQNGMFSFSGLSDAAVGWLRDKRSIYVVGGGRINVAGLTGTNIDYVCDSITQALKQT